jgi:hypothetical protein
MEKSGGTLSAHTRAANGFVSHTLIHTEVGQNDLQVLNEMGLMLPDHVAKRAAEPYLDSTARSRSGITSAPSQWHGIPSPVRLPIRNLPGHPATGSIQRTQTTCNDRAALDSSHLGSHGCAACAPPAPIRFTSVSSRRPERFAHPRPRQLGGETWRACSPGVTGTIRAKGASSGSPNVLSQCRHLDWIHTAYSASSSTTTAAAQQFGRRWVTCFDGEVAVAPP